MGRMKEIFMQMQEEQYDGCPRAYVQAYAASIQNKDTYVQIPCPNCNKSKLLYNSPTDVNCQDCGQKFVLVDVNTLRYA